MAALSAAFTIAVNDWQWLEADPMAKVTKPREPRGRVRFLDDAERARLLKACEESSNPYLHTVVVLALSTGMRQSEIMRLRWPDIDLDGGRITLHETKNDERRVVPLAGRAHDLLSEHAMVRRLDTDLVFPALRTKRPSTELQPMHIRAAWGRAVKAAEIEDFRFHDLRHSAASYLAMNGATLMEIAAVLGHKTLAMVKRYSHLSESDTAGVVAKMNEKLFGA